MQSPELRKPSGRRDAIFLAALFVLMIAGLAGLAIATGWAETQAALMRLSLAQILFLLVLSLVNYGFRGLRWHLFATRLGLNTALAQNMRHFIGGFAMSATPGRVGELIRMRWIRRETGWSFERTAPLVLMDRGSDLVAMALILALSLALSAGGIVGGAPVVALALVGAYVATHPKLLEAFANLSYRITGRFARLLVKLRRAAGSLETFRSPWTIVIATTLGAVGWFAEGAAFYYLLSWLGAETGLWMAVAIFLFSTLAGGLTGAPGGVGGAEAAMIALLTLEGIPLAVSIPATLIIRLTTLWFAIILGLMVFPLAERASKRAAHADATA